MALSTQHSPFEPLESRRLLAAGLSATYYDELDFSGKSVTRVDPAINFYWQEGAPAGGIAADTFSVRWTGTITARYSETYTFHTTTDDGVRLWVDGKLIIDKWRDQGATEHTGTVALTAGKAVPIRMEYYDRYAGAVARLQWSSPRQARENVTSAVLDTGPTDTGPVVSPTPPTPAPTPAPTTQPGLKAEYFNNTTLTGTPVLTRTDAQVNFDLGAAAPAPGVPADNFSVRWTGALTAPTTGTYTFHTLSDDGVRLWVNNQLLIDQWTDRAPTEHSATLPLTAGQQYTIKMEYYERTGGATAKLLWTRPGGAKEVIPGTALATPAQSVPTYEVSQYGGRLLYVAPTPGGAANGTISAPFGSIQAAAEVALPGDVVLIRAGTYRETVTPRNSGTQDKPIVFKPYNNEKVVISGADVLTGWTLHRDAIYKTQMPWTLGDGYDQIFVNGQMMIEARWPNTSLDVSRPRKATSDGGRWVDKAQGLGQVDDNELTQPDGFWEGARIHIVQGPGWYAQSGTVVESRPGSLKYQTRVTYSPSGGNDYYLTGKFQTLDAPTEWFRERSSSLYLWSSGNANPEGQIVEAKRRQQAFDLRDRSGIIIEQLELFACNIVTNSGSSGNTVDGIKARYVSHFTNLDNHWREMENSGIVLHGSGNELRNSVLSYSAGNGVSLKGRGHRVHNNVIHDVDYSALDMAGIYTGHHGSYSEDHEISYNTIFNSGRSLIVNYGMAGGKILNNELFYAGLQTSDLGGIYTHGTDGKGTEIAYNLIHDIVRTGDGDVGIYLDKASSNFHIHHNVVWNVGVALAMNSPSTNNLVHNNTLVGISQSISSVPGDDFTGSVVMNNLFTRRVNTALATPPKAPAEFNNIYNADTSVFVDARSHDYRLAQTSPAIDAGRLLPAHSIDYVGKAPDAGAYEMGAPEWTAGATNVTAVAPHRLSPAFVRLEAENLRSQQGTVADRDAVGSLGYGDWIGYADVDLAEGATSFTAWIGTTAAHAAQRIELRLGGLAGPTIGILETVDTTSWYIFKPVTIRFPAVSGKHDLFLISTTPNKVARIDAFVFGK